MDKKHTVWPVDKLPKKWQRPELDQLKEEGYYWEDPRDAIDIFEAKVARFAGSKYAVAIDCCSHGLFLCMKYLKCKDTITIPKNTYVSPPMQIIHAGCKVKFEDLEWSGIYQLKPYPIWDGAVRWQKDMFVGGDDTLQVVSFQVKKRIPIGKGGIIMTNNKKAYEWFKYASYDGRDLTKQYLDDDFKMIGYHFYMTPEDAARGILLMDQIPEFNEDTGSSKTYTDLSNKKIFKSKT